MKEYSLHLSTADCDGVKYCFVAEPGHGDPEDIGEKPAKRKKTDGKIPTRVSEEYRLYFFTAAQIAQVAQSMLLRYSSKLGMNKEV